MTGRNMFTTIIQQNDINKIAAHSFGR